MIDISREDNVKRIRREIVKSMKNRKRVEDDSDLEQLVYERMQANGGATVDEREMILMDWVDLGSKSNDE